MILYSGPYRKLKAVTVSHIEEERQFKANKIRPTLKYFVWINDFGFYFTFLLLFIFIPNILMWCLKPNSLPRYIFLTVSWLSTWITFFGMVSFHLAFRRNQKREIGNKGAMLFLRSILHLMWFFTIAYAPLMIFAGDIPSVKALVRPAQFGIGISMGMVAILCGLGVIFFMSCKSTS